MQKGYDAHTKLNENPSCGSTTARTYSFERGCRCLFHGTPAVAELAGGRNGEDQEIHP